MRVAVVQLGAVVLGVLGVNGCASYQELNPEARSVTATISRPAEKCSSLGNVNGTSGGDFGGLASNESLIEYAMNDLRNRAAKLGATHVVYSAPGFRQANGSATTATVMGEALRCEARQAPSAGANPIATPAPAAGCEYDTQCKGTRVCVNRQCVDAVQPSDSQANAAPPAAVSPPLAAATR